MVSKLLPQSITELQPYCSEYSPNLEATWSGAVAVLLVQDHICFIVRSEEMPSHKGQVAFFGGHKQEGEDPIATAKRELFEESAMRDVECLGLLHPVKTTRLQVIIPVLMRANFSVDFMQQNIRNNGEWSEAIWLPVKNLLNFDDWSMTSKLTPERKYDYLLFYPILAGQYRSNSNSPCASHVLWGASAQMIWNSLKVIQKLVDRAD